MAARSVSSKLSWRKRPETHLHPLDPAILALVNALFTASRELSLCQKPKVCQRSNAKFICRRVGSLCSLFEEVRDSEVWVPPSALASFRQLRTVFRNIKALIHNCRHTSNLLLLMELQDFMANQFHKFTQTIASALSSLPCDLLEVSEEVREQVVLVQKQASTATPFIDPDEKQLQTEILSVMEDFEIQISPNPDKLKHIFESLRFNDATDCERELFLLENEKERLKNDQQFANIPNINSLISFVRYARCVLYGLAPEQQVAASCRKYDLASPSMRKVVLAREEDAVDGVVIIPDDFRCPISLELMVDPVTVASGQTYERTAITRWLEEGHTTCPKTGLKLTHNTVIPNCSLRRLIMQWCAENEYVLESVERKGSRVDELPNTKAALEATKLTAQFLVEKLSKGTVEVQRQAACELRLMAKEGMDNRACVAAAGAVPFLAALLDSDDKKTQENAVTALLNLSINEKNKDVIMETEGALDRIVAVLAGGGTVAARENAAAALFSLSTAKEYRVEVGSRTAAIEGLLKLLREGSTRGIKDAASTLFNVALDGENAALLLMKGAVLTAIDVLASEGSDSVATELVALLAVLARRPDGMAAVSAGIGRVLAELVQLLSEGGNRAKEHAVALLLAASSFSEARGTAAALRCELRRSSALFLSLRRLLVGGTPRAQRKAASLLKVLQRYTD